MRGNRGGWQSRGGFGGRRGGFGGQRGRGRGRGGPRGFNEPPSHVEILGEFTHSCEGVLVCKATNANAPLINRPVFLENMKKIGVVDEVFGPVNSFVYADPYHLKPVSFFQQRSKPAKTSKPVGEQAYKGPPIAKGPNAIYRPRGARGRFVGGRGSFIRGRGPPRGRGAY